MMYVKPIGTHLITSHLMEHGNQFKSQMNTAGVSVLGLRDTKPRGRFDESDTVITNLVEEKNNVHKKLL